MSSIQSYSVSESYFWVCVSAFMVLGEGARVYSLTV